MKKKELSVLITAGLAAFLTVNNGQAVKAVEQDNTIVKQSAESISDDSDIQQNGEAIYLSEIQYAADKSRTDYGNITYNSTINNTPIKMTVDGELVEFKKGVAAHATSTVVYDIRNYKENYNRFTSYVGIDHSQSGRGDGVKFSFYTSVDGEEWTLAKDLGLITSSQEASYVDIDISNANYIKLYAHCNGHNGNDHAVYGEAKLVSKNSSMNSEIDSSILMEVDEYDSILNSKGIQENIANNEMIILRRDFVNKVGYVNLKRLAAEDSSYKRAIEYLLNDKTALRYYVSGGDINIKGSYAATIRYFADIYEKYSMEFADSTDNYFNLRLAISISQAFANKDLSVFWAGGKYERDSALRYKIYQQLVSTGKMDEGGTLTPGSKWSGNDFKNLAVPLMKWTVDNRMHNDEILWLADFVISQKDVKYDCLDAYSYINYTFDYKYNNPILYNSANYDSYNGKYNFKNFINNYGEESYYRLWMIFEEGAVCGGLSKTYSNIADTFGRPSSVVGQPGHAAAITYGYSTKNKRHEWSIQNDIYGWTASGNEYTDRLLGWGTQSFSEWYSASYAVLATEALKNYEGYMNAVRLNILAESYSDINDKREAYLEALKAQNINFDSMIGLINTYKLDENASSTDFFKLGKRIIETYTYYPQAMMELLSTIKENITVGNELAELEMLENKALVLASKATADNSPCESMTKQLANKYLGSVSTELADFSFDGENAGKIVINSKYNDSDIRIKYSLDGGNKWTDTAEHIVTLSEEELDSITAENDIKIGLVGGNDIFTIDILEGRAITDTAIYASDLENLLIGATDNLEFSLDNGANWCDYISGLEEGIRITGDKNVKVRYKAYGRYMQSNVYEYTFTEDVKVPERSYLPLRYVTLEAYGSQNNNTTHAAANFIDGNINTYWHTRFYYNEPDKSYTVSFDKVRYLTSLEYTPSGLNGRIKNAEIYTSMDGENFVKSGSVSNLSSDASVKTIDLDEAAACRYLKLVATETHGNSYLDANMFFSGKMLNFFEDTTKAYNPEGKLTYSKESVTNEDVTVSLEVPEGCRIEGENSYVFTENGSYTFEFIDADGVKRTAEANVDWIDKEAPEAVVKYDVHSWTNSKVTASLEDLSEEVTFINGESYTFEDNGEYIFEFVDKAGNIGQAIAKVDWIKDESFEDKIPEELPDKDVVEEDKPGSEGNSSIEVPEEDNKEDSIPDKDVIEENKPGSEGEVSEEVPKKDNEEEEKPDKGNNSQIKEDIIESLVPSLNKPSEKDTITNTEEKTESRVEDVIIASNKGESYDSDIIRESYAAGSIDYLNKKYNFELAEEISDLEEESKEVNDYSKSSLIKENSSRNADEEYVEITENKNKKRVNIPVAAASGTAGLAGVAAVLKKLFFIKK